MYTLLSLDVSTSNTGYAIFQNGTYKESGNIKKRKGIEELEGIIDIGRKILLLLDEIKPNHLIIEDTFMGPKCSSKDLDRLHGIIIGYALEHSDIMLDYIVSTEWRKLKGWPGNKTLTKLGITNRTAWYKKKSIEEVNVTHNLTLKDDNIADAINIGEAFITKMNKIEQKTT